MSAHVLLNLLNEMWMRDKMRGLSSSLCLFRNEFDKFNNAEHEKYVRLYLSYDSTITLKSHFCCKTF